jgi:hypothetical protein
MDEPMRPNPNTETEEPILAKERSDRELPICTKSGTDRTDLRHAHDLTDKELPK